MNFYLCDEWDFLLFELYDFIGFEVLWIGIVYFNINGIIEYVRFLIGNKVEY